jgi:hypothetical protein
VWLVSKGSACIYSKKVEGLYTLVFHTLDMVTQQKRSANAKASSVKDNGEDADILLQEEHFLELDDVLKEATNIDLVEDEEEGIAALLRKNSTTPRTRLGALRLEQSLGMDPFRITSSNMQRDGTLLLDHASKVSWVG